MDIITSHSRAFFSKLYIYRYPRTDDYKFLISFGYSIRWIFAYFVHLSPDSVFLCVRKEKKMKFNFSIEFKASGNRMLVKKMWRIQRKYMRLILDGKWSLMRKKRKKMNRSGHNLAMVKLFWCEAAENAKKELSCRYLCALTQKNWNIAPF